MVKNNPDNGTYKKIGEWLDYYHSTDSKLEKERYKTLIVTNMYPVIKNIARAIARRAYDPIEDLTQAGFIGLLKAIDKYDKEKNDNFRVYAGYFIIGEIKHYLRDKLNMIRVPRHIHELTIRINNFIKDLTLEEIRALTSDEVAYALDVPTKTVDIALQVDRRCSTISLEDAFSICESNLYYEEFLTHDNFREMSEYEDARIIFQDVIKMLDPDDKIYIDMYYYQDLSKKEIADLFVTSKATISRKMKQVFDKIADLVVEGHRKNIEDEDSGLE